MKIDPRQCVAARALLRWEQKELAERAGVARRVVQQIEAGQKKARESTIAKIVGALEAAGIILLNGDPLGVALKNAPEAQKGD